MVRTQVQLTEEQARTLKQVAAARGVSIAEVIREALDGHLTAGDAATRRQRAIDAIGGFRSGRHDVSARHDEYLNDALEQ